MIGSRYHVVVTDQPSGVQWVRDNIEGEDVWRFFAQLDWDIVSELREGDDVYMVFPRVLDVARIVGVLARGVRLFVVTKVGGVVEKCEICLAR